MSTSSAPLLLWYTISRQSLRLGLREHVLEKRGHKQEPASSVRGTVSDADCAAQVLLALGKDW